MKHIALFNEACSLIFTMLYDQFPIPLDFDQREIGFYRNFDLSESGQLRRVVLSETLAFLRAEGFLVFQYHRDTPTIGILQARLTAKGLTKLQRIPDGIRQDSKPLIEQLKEASLSIGDKASSAGLSTALKRAIDLILS